LYPGEGGSSLTDGLLGTRDHQDGLWLGFQGKDLEAVLDLGEARRVERIGLDCLQTQGAWIFLPRWVEFAYSADGEFWEVLGRVEIPGERSDERESRLISLDVPRTVGPIRYVRVSAGNQGPLPEWHPGAGEEAWLFVDEIVVE
jgi:hypothetical protein